MAHFRCDTNKRENHSSVLSPSQQPEETIKTYRSSALCTNAPIESILSRSWWLRSGSPTVQASWKGEPVEGAGKKGGISVGVRGLVVKTSDNSSARTAQGPEPTWFPGVNEGRRGSAGADVVGWFIRT